MKGQLSFEYLILSSIALILIFFSVSALLSIKSSFSNSLDLLSFKESAASLSNSINLVCSLGSGNSQQLFLKHDLLIDSENNLIRLRSKTGNFSSIFNSKCSILESEILSGLINIKNENGIINLENS